MTSERRLELQRKLAEHVGWKELQYNLAMSLWGIPPAKSGMDYWSELEEVPAYVLDPWDMVKEYSMWLVRHRTTTDTNYAAYAGRNFIGVIENSHWHSDPRDAVFELYCRLKGLI